MTIDTVAQLWFDCKNLPEIPDPLVHKINFFSASTSPIDTNFFFLKGEFLGQFIKLYVTALGLQIVSI